MSNVKLNLFAIIVQKRLTYSISVLIFVSVNKRRELMNERTELGGFKDGYARGQLAMIKTIEFALELGASNEQLTNTLNKLKKQIGDSNEES